MSFFSRWGYMVVVFFLVAAFLAGGLGVAYHLTRESTSVLLFSFWGLLCAGFVKLFDRPDKPSTLFGIRIEYWGYGLIVLAVLDTYFGWDAIARDWLAAV